MASPVRVLLFGGLGLLATVLFSKTVFASDEGSAADLPPPPAKPPSGTRTIPKRGPNGTVLLADLPPDCKAKYQVAFYPDTPASLVCESLDDLYAEIQRFDALYESGDPFYDAGNHQALVNEYDESYALCVELRESAGATDEENIRAWVACLSRYNLTPDQVWAG